MYLPLLLLQEFTLEGLKTYTQYLVSLRVYNPEGDGPETIVVVMTDEGGESCDVYIICTYYIGTVFLSLSLDEKKETTFPKGKNRPREREAFLFSEWAKRHRSFLLPPPTVNLSPLPPPFGEGGRGSLLLLQSALCPPTTLLHLLLRPTLRGLGLPYTCASIKHGLSK